MKNIILLIILSILICFILFNCEKQQDLTSSWYYYDETYCSNKWGITNNIPNDELVPIVFDYLDNKNIEVLDMEIFFNHSILQNCDSCQCKTGKRIRIHTYDENNEILTSELFYFDDSLQTTIDPPQQIELNYDFECSVDSFFYYYSGDDLQYLTLDHSKIVIVFTDSTSKEYLDYLALNSTQLDSVKYAIYGYRIAFGYLKDNTTCDMIYNTIINLNSDSMVWSINPTFLDSFGDERIFFNQVLVSNSTSESYSQLMQLIKGTDTEIIKETRLYFAIWTDKYSTGNALSIANYFYETGYFDWAQPSFLVQVVPYNNQNKFL